MADAKFLPPSVAALSKLISSEEYKALTDLYDAEIIKVLNELNAAADDRALTIVQGKYKMLKRLRYLPEETVDRYINEVRSKQ